MGIARYAAAWSFTWKVGVLVIGMAWIVAIPQWDWIRPANSPEKEESALGAGPAAETTVVRMKPAEGRSFSFYSLEDEEGNEVARLTYSRRGLVVNLNESLRARPGLSAWADGSCEFVVSLDQTHYRFKLRPGGTSGLLILDERSGERDGLGVAPDGRLVHGPSTLD